MARLRSARVQWITIAAGLWAALTAGVLLGWELAGNRQCNELLEASVAYGAGEWDGPARPMRGVVLTTYFTSREDFQRKAFVDANSHEYMRSLYDSAIREGIELVIFHDGLSSAFVERWANALVTFIRVKLRPTIAMNDERFLFYEEFLADHKEFDFVLMADITDVELLDNPFLHVRASHATEDIRQSEGESRHCRLWISQEQSTGKAAQWLFGHPDPCYTEPRNFVNLNIDLKRRLYNAGAIAGTREEVRLLLQRLALEFARMDHHEANCNMAVLQYVIQRHYDANTICEQGMCWKDLCGSGLTVIAHKRGQTAG